MNNELPEPLSRMIRTLLIKMAIWFFVILVVGGIVGFLAFKGSDLVLYLFAAAFIGAAGMLAFYLRGAVVRGAVEGRFGGITCRHTSPISFWFQIGIHGLLAVFLFFNGLAFLGLAPHWFIALVRSMHSHH